jgi:VanZ family protein
VRIRDRLGIDERRFRQLTHLMELALVGMFFVGLERGHTGILVNTAVALGVTQLVPVLERDVGIPMDPALTLWITAAVFLHALGTVGIPGTELESFYRQVWWWDHMTHALSASVVAAAGYATARAVDLHSEDVYLPPRFMFVFILLLTVAFGVFWEVIEFSIAEVAALTGGAPVLTQYGLGDTLLDLVFDTIGAVVVATWGTAYLSDVVGAITDRFEARSG